jgi:hypothetical protein
MPQPARFGYIRTVVARLAAAGADFTATSALDLMTGYVPGFRCELESIIYTPTTAHTGAGGTLDFELVSVTNGVSTIVTTITIALASVDVKGETVKKAIALGAAGAALLDSSSLTLRRKAGGTVFATGAGEFTIIARQQPQRRD